MALAFIESGGDTWWSFGNFFLWHYVAFIGIFLWHYVAFMGIIRHMQCVGVSPHFASRVTGYRHYVAFCGIFIPLLLSVRNERIRALIRWPFLGIFFDWIGLYEDFSYNWWCRANGNFSYRWYRAFI